MSLKAPSLGFLGTSSSEDDNESDSDYDAPIQTQQSRSSKRATTTVPRARKAGKEKRKKESKNDRIRRPADKRACPFCDSVLGTGDRFFFVDHVTRHVGLVSWRCSLCDVGFATRHAFYGHKTKRSCGGSWERFIPHDTWKEKFAGILSGQHTKEEILQVVHGVCKTHDCYIDESLVSSEGGTVHEVQLPKHLCRGLKPQVPLARPKKAATKRSDPAKRQKRQARVAAAVPDLRNDQAQLQIESSEHPLLPLSVYEKGTTTHFCRVCKRYLRLKDKEYVDHMFQHFKFPGYSCSLCRKRMSSKKQFYPHRQQCMRKEQFNSQSALSALSVEIKQKLTRAVLCIPSPDQLQLLFFSASRSEGLLGDTVLDNDTWKDPIDQESEKESELRTRVLEALSLDPQGDRQLTRAQWRQATQRLYQRVLAQKQQRAIERDKVRRAFEAKNGVALNVVRVVFGDDIGGLKHAGRSAKTDRKVGTQFMAQPSFVVMLGDTAEEDEPVGSALRRPPAHSKQSALDALEDISNEETLATGRTSKLAGTSQIANHLVRGSQEKTDQTVESPVRQVPLQWHVPIEGCDVAASFCREAAEAVKRGDLRHVYARSVVPARPRLFPASDESDCYSSDVMGVPLDIRYQAPRRKTASSPRKSLEAPPRKIETAVGNTTMKGVRFHCRLCDAAYHCQRAKFVEHVYSHFSFRPLACSACHKNWLSKTIDKIVELDAAETELKLFPFRRLVHNHVSKSKCKGSVVEVVDIPALRDDLVGLACSTELSADEIKTRLLQLLENTQLPVKYTDEPSRQFIVKEIDNPEYLNFRAPSVDPRVQQAENDDPGKVRFVTHRERDVLSMVSMPYDASPLRQHFERLTQADGMQGLAGLVPAGLAAHAPCLWHAPVSAIPGVEATLRGESLGIYACASLIRTRVDVIDVARACQSLGKRTQRPAGVLPKRKRRSVATPSHHAHLQHQQQITKAAVPTSSGGRWRPEEDRLLRELLLRHRCIPTRNFKAPWLRDRGMLNTRSYSGVCQRAQRLHSELPELHSFRRLGRQGLIPGTSIDEIRASSAASDHSNHDADKASHRGKHGNTDELSSVTSTPTVTLRVAGGSAGSGSTTGGTSRTHGSVLSHHSGGSNFVVSAGPG
ncbi:MAG: hypothetical protein MHM6MM_004443 [Cercozoa sp. M6MM]